MTAARRGFVLIVAATIVSGAIGYAITLVVFRFVGPGQYATFAVFWATMFLLMGALGGIQQEITRSTHRIEAGSRTEASDARLFAIVVAGAVALLILATSPLWVGAVYPDAGWALVPPLALAVGSSVFVAVVGGSLFGLSSWTALACMIAVDPLLRIILLSVTLIFTRDVVLLAWMVALPVPLALLVLWPFLRTRLVGHSQLDVDMRRLGWNSARAVGAAAATGVLVSGFPLLLELTSPEEPRALIGELIFIITLTRAPLIITVMSLQSYFIVQFRARSEHIGSALARILGLIAGGGAVLAVLAWWLGPPVFAFLTARPVSIDGLAIAMFVVSSALVAALAAAGAAVLTRSSHTYYVIGWAVAALVTAVLLLLPIELLPRIALALLVAPVAGLAVHLFALTRPRRVPLDRLADTEVAP